jgi:hypothetical protein
MKIIKVWMTISVATVIMAAAISVCSQTTEFTYQGSLKDGSNVANGNYDFEFAVFDAPSGGTQVGVGLTRANTAVTNGVFAANLNFGSIFTGADRFLEIRVRNAGPGSYNTLSPRQKLTSAPYSIRAAGAGEADSLSSNCSLCITDAHIQSIGGNKIAGGTITSVQLAAGAVTEDKLSIELLNSAQRQRTLLGSLRWDVLKGQNDFNAGSGPRGLAFDGQNIWVTNQSSNNVTKLRANDGANLGTFAVGTGPTGIAFDGTNIWVMNSSSSNLTKLRASDGANLGTIASVSGNDVVFDGANIWVASFNGGMVGRYRASDGASLGFVAAGNSPRGLVFDGANIWVSNQSDAIVRRLRASDGSLVAGLIPTGTTPMAMAFDGENIWVVNNTSNNVTKLRASDGSNLGTFAAGTSPKAIAFDGTNIWITNSTGVVKLRASDGTNLGSFAVTGAQGVAFDGANIWVTASANVRRMQPAFAQ